MREILFKAKRLDSGEWVEGYYVQIHGSNLHYIATGKLEIKNIQLGLELFEIEPETLCQYTGLKDKNDNKIWENDVCEMVYDGKVNIYVVVWDKDELDFKGTNGKENYGNQFEYITCCEEVIRIGNKFDKPELMERKK